VEKESKEIRDIAVAEKILDKDHYGLEKIKERIIEYLAVRQLVKNPKAPFSASSGPPGVGKTSLATSIGKATDANSFASHSAEFVMKLKSADIAALTSAPCPARSFK